jgi:hypothetical protein
VRRNALVKRVAVPLLFLIGCSGSGATVSDSSASEISAGRPPAVEPARPVEPVDPGTSFECKTSGPLSDGSIATIRFALHGEALDPAIEIEIEPQASVLAPLAKATLERAEGKLVLTTTERAELTLFENSDLTRGYVKVASEYSEVFCTKR